MAKLVDVFKKILGGRVEQPGQRRPRHSDPQFVGRSSMKEIDEAPPERVGELVGHAVERVDT